MSEKTYFCQDPNRALISLAGVDRVAFLQGLVSNSVEKVTEDHGIWSALLTPQGKYLHDFFLTQDTERLLIECEKDRMMDLGQRLRKFKLRSDIALDIAGDYSVILVWGKALEGLPHDLGQVERTEISMILKDPRLSEMGWRIYTKDSAKTLEHLKSLGAEEADYASWDQNRVSLAVPNGAKDCEVEKAILLEYGFDELNGLDWRKGCYMGQELTARTKYRGLVKKRFLKIKGASSVLEVGAKLRQSEAEGGKEIGSISSVVNDVAAGLIRLDRLVDDEDGRYLAMIGDESVQIEIPSWAEISFPE